MPRPTTQCQKAKKLGNSREKNEEWESESSYPSPCKEGWASNEPGEQMCWKHYGKDV